MTDLLSIHRTLTKKQILHEAFRFFDKDGNGTVEPEEISEVMTKLGVDLSVTELVDIMSNLDQNGDGVMDFAEFLIMMEPRKNAFGDNIDDEDEILELTFNVFDKKKDGKIDADEIKETLACLGENLSDKEVKQMLDEADMDGDGVLDFEEFMKMMKDQNPQSTEQ